MRPPLQEKDDNSVIKLSDWQGKYTIFGLVIRRSGRRKAEEAKFCERQKEADS